MKTSSHLLLLTLPLITGAFAIESIEPTEVRVWTTTNGSRTKAKAVELTPNGTVKFVTPDGREVVLAIDQLTKSDQALLEKHFEKDGSEIEQPAETGELKGPLKADADTSYYLYLPKNLDPKLRSPVMIWTQSDGAKAETLESFREAADLLGMIVATPIEARYEGSVTLLNNLVHSNDVLKEVGKDFSISKRAVYYGGDKTGASAAMWNALKNKSAGTFTVSGFLTENMSRVSDGHHFMAGGTNSIHRYLTAWSAAKFGDDGTHYFYEGGREFPDEDVVTLGMAWMYARSLYEDYGSRSDEARAFEKRILPWLKELAETSPGEAAYLIDTLSEDCALRGGFKQKIASLRAKLGRDENAVAHVKGVEALDEFSEDELSKYGNHYSPLKGHAPKKFERMTEKLARKFEKAENLTSIFEQLAKPTNR